MNGRKYILPCLLVLVGLALTGCATTKVTAVWKDKGYQAGPVKRVFIIGVGGTPEMRRFFEEEFAEQLRARGTEAVTSYRLIPSDQKLDKEAIVSKIGELKADAVLITRMVGSSVSETYVAGDLVAAYEPEPVDNWYGFYSAGFIFVEAPAYGYENDIRFVETKLYATSTERPIWAAQSKVWIDGPRTEVISSFVKIMVNKLHEDRLLQ